MFILSCFFQNSSKQQEWEVRSWEKACVALGLALASAGANAWMAYAIGNGNYSFVSFNNATKEQAIAGALKGCRERASGCEVKGSVNGAALVIAKGRDGWSASTNMDPDKARRQALASCRERYRDCSVGEAVWDTGVAWAALALSDDVTPKTAIQYDSQADAESKAMELCRKAAGESGSKCRVEPAFSTRAHVHFVYATSPTRVGVGMDSSLEEAERGALRQCEKSTPAGETCKVSERHENRPFTEPAGMKKILAEAEANNKPGRGAFPGTPPLAPTTKTVRCTNQCVNGLCNRVFSDGRRDRWQAPRVYDPFNKTWTWDITTNACGL